jgi:hypothetical protein
VVGAIAEGARTVTGRPIGRSLARPAKFGRGTGLATARVLGST